jgi:1A family penicillin-binding protein
MGLKNAIQELRRQVQAAELRGKWRRLVPTWRRGALYALLLVPLALLGWERCGVRGCPSVDRLAAYQPGNAPVVLDRDGGVVAELSPVQREIVPFGDLPAHVGEAFIAVEDQRFRTHGGVDVRRVFGALLADVRAGGWVQGSSTITMQVARNVFPDRLPGAQKTLRRKLLEVRVAREIERRFTKDEILELYLNHIYFGAGVYGIEPASRHYFGRAASDLTVAQAATLAALPRSPNYYDPRRNPTAARSRRDLVLTLMEEQGRLEAAEAERARGSRLTVASRPSRPAREAAVAPWFVEAVRRLVEDELGDGLYSAPLRIHTTLDRGAQRAAEEELRRQLQNVENGVYGAYRGERYRAGTRGVDYDPEYLQGAVVILDARDGDVLALVGGRDFGHSAFDRASRARRQVGSAFKPFVFARALEEGYAPSQRVADEPLRMELAGGEVWEPRNFTGGFEGEVTVRDALVRSKNVPAVRMAEAVGIRDVTRLARRAGVHSDIPQLPSMALGTGTMSPLEITAAYTVFANGGRATTPRFVTHIEDPEGRVVWRTKAHSRKVLKPAVAFLVTDMLAESLERGTATSVRRAGFRGPAAGKTGTTDGGTDAWFVGYTPEFVTGVWIGFDRPAPIVGDASGGRIAAPLWGRVMQRLQQGRPAAEPWAAPDRIVRLAVDPATGLVLADGCRPEGGRRPGQEYFIRGSEPASVCPAGAREGGPGLGARIRALARNAFHGAGTWIAARFGREEEDDIGEAERERILGTRRLPRAVEVRQPEIEPRRYPELLGRPWTGELPPLPGDTAVHDTTALRDTTLVRDTLRPPPDTLRPPPDTLRPPPDTVPPPPTGTGVSTAPGRPPG